MNAKGAARADKIAEVSDWVAAAIAQQTVPVATIERALDQPRGWIANRLSPRFDLGFRPVDLSEIARLLELTTPDDVIEAAAEVTGAVAGVRTTGLRRPEQTDLAAVGSAEREMEIVFVSAVADHPWQARNSEWVRRRFGLGQSAPESLAAVAKRASVSKERVRQVEVVVLSRARSAVVGRVLPQLSVIRDRVTAEPGKSRSIIEPDLRSALGEVTLASALRFLSVISPVN